MQEDPAIFFGLSHRDMMTIRQVFSRYPVIRKVWIFGSRSKGNYRSGSDIDLAIMDEGIDPGIIRHIRADFEDSSLPYEVDVLHFASLDHQELKEHIQRVGKELPVH